MSLDLSTDKHYLIVSLQQPHYCVGTYMSNIGSPEQSMRLYKASDEDELSSSKGDPGYADRLRWRLKPVNGKEGRYQLINKHSGLAMRLLTKKDKVVQCHGDDSGIFTATITRLEKSGYHPFLQQDEQVPLYRIEFENKGELLMLAADGDRREDRVLGKSGDSDKDSRQWFLLEDGLQNSNTAITIQNPDLGTTETHSGLDYAYMIAGPLLEEVAPGGGVLSAGLGLMLGFIDGSGGSENLYQKLYDAIYNAMSALLNKQTIDHWKHDALVLMKEAGDRAKDYQRVYGEQGATVKAFSYLYGSQAIPDSPDDGVFQILKQVRSHLDTSSGGTDDELSREYFYSGMGLYVNATSEYLACIEEMLKLWEDGMEVGEDEKGVLPGPGDLREEYSEGVKSAIKHINTYYTGGGIGSDPGIKGFRQKRKEAVDTRKYKYLYPSSNPYAGDTKMEVEYVYDGDSSLSKNVYEDRLLDAEERLNYNQMRIHVAASLDRTMGNIGKVVREWKRKEAELYEDTDTPKTFAAELEWYGEELVQDNAGSNRNKLNENIDKGDPAQTLAKLGEGSGVVWQTNNQEEIIIGVAATVNTNKKVDRMLVTVLNLNTGEIRYESDGGELDVRSYEKWVELEPGQAMTGIALREKNDNAKNLKIYYQNIDRSNPGNDFLEGIVHETRYPNGGDNADEYEIEYRPYDTQASGGSGGDSTRSVNRDPAYNRVVTGIYLHSNDKHGGFDCVVLKVAKLRKK